MAKENIFIVGMIKYIDPVTKVTREEPGPVINLSEVIRNMKFPQRIVKPKVTPRKRFIAPVAPKSLPKTTSVNDLGYSNRAANDNSIVQNTRQPEVSQVGSIAQTQSQNPPVVSPPSPNVSSHEAMILKQALTRSLEETVPNHNTAVAPEEFAESDFEGMTESEQLALALKMSFQEHSPLTNEHAYSVAA